MRSPAVFLPELVETQPPETFILLVFEDTLVQPPPAVSDLVVAVVVLGGLSQWPSLPCQNQGTLLLRATSFHHPANSLGRLVPQLPLPVNAGLEPDAPDPRAG